MTYDERPRVAYYDCTSGGAQYCQGCYTMTEEQYGDWVKADDLFSAVAIQGIANFFGLLRPDTAPPDGFVLVEFGILSERCLDAAIKDAGIAQDVCGDLDVVLSAGISAYLLSASRKDARHD